MGLTVESGNSTNKPAEFKLGTKVVDTKLENLLKNTPLVYDKDGKIAVPTGRINGPIGGEVFIGSDGKEFVQTGLCYFKSKDLSPLAIYTDMKGKMTHHAFGGLVGKGAYVNDDSRTTPNQTGLERHLNANGTVLLTTRTLKNGHFETTYTIDKNGKETKVNTSEELEGF